LKTEKDKKEGEPEATDDVAASARNASLVMDKNADA